MASVSGFVSIFNSSVDLESYVSHSIVKQIETVNEKIAVVIYSIVLFLSIIQTFWKNKRIDHFLAYMNDAYSDRKFESNQVYFRHQIMTCYRYDQRFSHIPNPNRLILLIIATHVQVLLLIAIRTLFIRRSELVNDCSSFHYPYGVLQCEDNRDPCRSNDTVSVPKCTYYYFELTHFITMVTSVITWHYALRYFVIKLVRFVRWMLFRDDDQPRRLCCCCRATSRILRCIMYFYYITFWLYLLCTILLGFVWNISIFRLPVDIYGPILIPIFVAADRVCALSLALIPELLQNWLEATENGEVLQDFGSKGLLLVNIEPLVYLINKNTKFPTSPNNKLSQTNDEVVF